MLLTKIYLYEKICIRGQSCYLVRIPSLKFKSWTNSNNDEAVSKKIGFSLKSLLTIRHLFITTFPTCQLPKGTYVLVLYIVLVLMCLNIYLPRLRLHKWAIYDLLKRDFSCTPSEMDLKGVLDSEKINKKECGFLCGHLFSFWEKKYPLDF